MFTDNAISNIRRIKPEKIAELDSRLLTLQGEHANLCRVLNDFIQNHKNKSLKGDELSRLESILNKMITNITLFDAASDNLIVDNKTLLQYAKKIRNNYNTLVERVNKTNLYSNNKKNLKIRNTLLDKLETDVVDFENM